MIRKNPDGTCYSCGDIENLIVLYKRTNGVFSYICRPCNSAKVKKYYDKRKLMVFEHYGNACMCCGEINPLFLSIDHVNDDGHLEVWPSGSRITGVGLYGRIIRNNYPDAYQLYCMNCNFGKRMNKGLCPHKMVQLV